MAKITNTHRITPRGLPNGVVLSPGETKNIPDWENIADRPIVRSWVASGLLVVEGADEKKAPPLPPKGNKKTPPPPPGGAAGGNTP